MNEENVIVQKISVERNGSNLPVKVVIVLVGMYGCVLPFSLKRIEELLNLFEVDDLKDVEGKACRIITDGNSGRGIKHLWKTDEVMI